MNKRYFKVEAFPNVIKDKGRRIRLTKLFDLMEYDNKLMIQQEIMEAIDENTLQIKEERKAIFEQMRKI